MKLKTIPREYQNALPILKKIEQAGYEAYFVGGSVRDVLLNQPIHDVDIATSAFPAEIKEIFPRTIDVGIEHGTVLVLDGDDKYEITTFRTESTYQDYRRPDHVEFVRSLAEDLKRRDFTINAFALKEDGEVIDLFDGLQDLTNQVLRAVGNPHERFHEDALRMMRGLRFVSQLGFELEKETFASIYENHALLAKISVERINIEFIKLLLGKYRNQGLKMFVETECYLYCPMLRNAGQGLLKFAELSEKQIHEEAHAWVLLLDQLQIESKNIRTFLKAWKCSNELIRTVQNVYEGLQRRKTSYFSKQLLYELGECQAVLVESLLPYFNLTADVSTVQEDYRQLPIHSLQDLAINGTVLMEHFDKKPGKWLKDTLSACEQAVVAGEISNQQSQLLVFAQQFI
ncbi:CCA tRNA nucleotidyltransferase [Enterococcus saccharolyticus]|uniref:CCA tRNA nucleotidyltransferase n=1 Tax=Enterococcus saccharolyticus TaxID=41997 RepID=UPI001E30F0AA|nr:CCA tRNA nucleotidyltransferase [Enterococcus saccharolyticus]MCD5001097.1 CCA tRNA nucleotidyltransferase [Enterococcus saccharolyticus]